MELFAIVFIVVGCISIGHVVVVGSKDDFDLWERDLKKKRK